MGREPAFDVVNLDDDPAYRAQALRLLETAWGTLRMVSRGTLYDLSDFPGFLALRSGDDPEPLGVLTYRIDGDQCEIMSLNSTAGGLGVGTALIDAAKDVARAGGCRRLWLITTNDNTHALRFYQRRGFHLAALYVNALDESRKLKPEIPPVGLDGIPLRDEIELDLEL